MCLDQYGYNQHPCQHMMHREAECYKLILVGWGGFQIILILAVHLLSVEKTRTRDEQGFWLLCPIEPNGVSPAEMPRACITEEEPIMLEPLIWLIYILCEPRQVRFQSNQLQNMPTWG